VVSCCGEYQRPCSFIGSALFPGSEVFFWATSDRNIIYPGPVADGPWERGVFHRLCHLFPLLTLISVPKAIAYRKPLPHRVFASVG
jgi:hypothetical protein